MDGKTDRGRRFEAVVFDLDGTLLDTLEDLTAAVDHVLTYHGFPPLSLEEVRVRVGDGLPVLMERCLPAGRDEPGYAGLVAELITWYTDHCQIATRPYDGIPTLLGRLRTEGRRIAVVSNKNDAAVKALVGIHFPGLVDIAVGTGPSCRPKPAPDGVRAALSSLGCGPRQAVYIGDSDVDEATARTAGTGCILCAWGFKGRTFLEEHFPTATIVDAPEEIPALLEG